MKKLKAVFILITLMSSLMLMKAYAMTDDEAIDKFKESVIASEWFGPMHGFDPAEEISHPEDYPDAEESLVLPVEVRDGRTTEKAYAVSCYCTMEEFEGYLKTLFSDELVKKFLDTDSEVTRKWKNGSYNGQYNNAEYVFGEHKMFEEINGVLYCYVDKFNEGDIETTGISVMENNSEKITLKLEYDVKIGTETSPIGSYSQLYTLVNDGGGNWVFEEFMIPSELWLSRVREYNNPDTSDAPVIAVCVLALSAAAAAVLVKKKHN